MLRLQAPHSSSQTSVAGSLPGWDVNLRPPRQRGQTTVALDAENIARICAASAGENGLTSSVAGTPQRASHPAP